MASRKQVSAAKRNITKAVAAAKRKRTISKLPKSVRRDLGRNAAAARPGSVLRRDVGIRSLDLFLGLNVSGRRGLLLPCTRRREADRDSDEVRVHRRGDHGTLDRVRLGCHFARSGASDRVAGFLGEGGDPGSRGDVGTRDALPGVVSALEHAGLQRWVLEAVAGNGFIPGITRGQQIADPAHPCEGAVPRVHAHFFTRDGLFGSLDWNGEQVDDGSYDVIDDRTFVVSKEFPDVTFTYEVHDDAITFEPVIPDCSPRCFEAAWSVSVAYPGEEWHRVSEPA